MSTNKEELKKMRRKFLPSRYVEYSKYGEVPTLKQAQINLEKAIYEEWQMYTSKESIYPPYVLEIYGRLCDQLFDLEDKLIDIMDIAENISLDGKAEEIFGDREGYYTTTEDDPSVYLILEKLSTRVDEMRDDLRSWKEDRFENYMHIRDAIRDVKVAEKQENYEGPRLSDKQYVPDRDKGDNYQFDDLIACARNYLCDVRRYERGEKTRGQIEREAASENIVQFFKTKSQKLTNEEIERNF